MNRAIAVLDIGKTNVKLALVDAATLTERRLLTRPNQPVTSGPYPHFDVDGLWGWLMDGLAGLAREAEIGAISVTTHGACGVLVDGRGPVLPVLDYEHEGPDEVAADYEAIRPDFAETYAARLPSGLNLARQLYWQQRRWPEAFARATAFLTYPQYWAWRLSGVMASEVTSLGCHTDLWDLREGRPSSLVCKMGWEKLLPPVRPAAERLGAVLPEIVRRCGLPADCRVVCGIHDSNATLLPHVLSRPAPFAVFSTGTWAVLFSVGGRLETLERTRDCLANVDALGRTVPCARFMAGREWDAMMAGVEPAPFDAATLAAVITRKVMAFAGFAPGVGPFPAAAGGWSQPVTGLSIGERTAAAALSLALSADECLRLTGAGGPVLVEGPLARNDWFCTALAALSGREVRALPGSTGTTAGAALLALGLDHRLVQDEGALYAPAALSGLAEYRQIWRERALQGLPPVASGWI
jgi:sugar (pentulose or hexulose) kinase